MSYSEELLHQNIGHSLPRTITTYHGDDSRCVKPIELLSPHPCDWKGARDTRLHDGLRFAARRRFSFCTRLLLRKCKKALTRAPSISPLDAEAAVNADVELRKHE